MSGTARTFGGMAEFSDGRKLLLRSNRPINVSVGAIDAMSVCVPGFWTASSPLLRFRVGRRVAVGEMC